MFRTSRKKNEYQPIKYFQEIDDIFFDKQKSKVPLLFKLTRRTVLFFSLLELVLLILYAIGNFQNFLDENMHLVVKVILFVSSALSFFTLSNLIEAVVFFIKKETKDASNYILHIILLFILLIFTLFILFSFSLIDILSSGI